MRIISPTDKHRVYGEWLRSELSRKKAVASAEEISLIENPDLRNDDHDAKREMLLLREYNRSPILDKLPAAIDWHEARTKGEADVSRPTVNDQGRNAMLYEAEREKILSVLEDMKADNLITFAGGALSLRCSRDHILITAAGGSFRRWRLTKEDFIVLDLKGNIIEMNERLGPSGTPLHLAIYEFFPRCQAVIHSHAAYSLAFACRGQPVPPEANLLETLGEVPCLVADDFAIKQRFRAHPQSIEIPPGMVQRADVAAVNILCLVPQIKEKMLPRKEELAEHGLAFTVYRHGVFVFARNMDEAFNNLARVEESARAHIFGALIQAREANLRGLP